MTSGDQTTRPAVARWSGQAMARARVPSRAGAIAWGLVLVVLAGLTLLGIVAGALHTYRGQSLEETMMGGLVTDESTDAVLLNGLQRVTVGAVFVALVVLLVVAYLRRRLDLGLAAGVLVAGANVMTQLLKFRLIERPDLGWSDPNTLPSGHVTVVTSLACATLLVLPARWRPVLVPLATLASIGTGLATMILRWHRPSDVLAAYAVVMGWIGIVVVGLALAGRVGGRLPRGGSGGRLFRYVMGTTIGTASIAALAQAADVAHDSARVSRSLMLGALATVAIGAALSISASMAVMDRLGDGASGRASERGGVGSDGGYDGDDGYDGDGGDSGGSDSGE